HGKSYSGIGRNKQGISPCYHLAHGNRIVFVSRPRGRKLGGRKIGLRGAATRGIINIGAVCEKSNRSARLISSDCRNGNALDRKVEFEDVSVEVDVGVVGACQLSRFQPKVKGFASDTVECDCAILSVCPLGIVSGDAYLRAKTSRRTKVVRHLAIPAEWIGIEVVPRDDNGLRIGRGSQAAQRGDQ